MFAWLLRCKCSIREMMVAPQGLACLTALTDQPLSAAPGGLFATSHFCTENAGPTNPSDGLTEAVSQHRTVGHVKFRN